MYQVEAWLAESLDSLLAQTYSHLEVILVDDGSTDRTAQIAREYVDKDPRFQLVQQPNAGLGAARNTGLRHVTGDLVAFLDSDDFVPRKAYGTMVRSLQRSGSDFAVGSFKREEGGRLRERIWARRVHANRRLGTTIDEVPEVLANVFAWTKMFRRTFLERTGLQFPEGVRYEDQVPMTRAYLLARAFDVLPESVYVWRKRDDGTSITQQKAEASDLHDRLAAKREISGMLVENASAGVTTNWYAKVFKFDLMGYMRAALRADDDYWRVLSVDVAALVERAPADVHEHVEVRFRVAAWLTAHGHRTALRRLLEYEDLMQSNFPARNEDGALFADLDFLGEDCQIPADLLRLRAVDRHLNVRLDSLDWSEPGRLRVGGVAVVRHVSPATNEVRTGLTLQAPGQPAVEVPAVPDPGPAGNLFANRLHEDHAGSRFRAELDLAELVRRSPDDPPRTNWDVTVTTTALGDVATDRFKESLQHGSAAMVRSAEVDGALVTARWDTEGLRIAVRRRYVVVHGVRAQGGDFELDLRTSPDCPIRTVLVGQSPVHSAVTAHPEGGGRHLVRVASADLAERDLPSRLHIGCAWPRPARAWLTDRLETVACEDVEVFPAALEGDREGSLRVVPNAPMVYVDTVEFDPDRVTVTGRTHLVSSFDLRLDGPRAHTAGVRTEAEQQRFSAVLPTTAPGWGGRILPLPANAYRVTAGSGQTPVDVRAGQVADDPPSRPSAHGWSLEVTDDRSITLRRASIESPEDRSAYAQQQLRSTVYEPARCEPRTETVLFECFGGGLCDDSPLAVSELLRVRRPDLDLVWSVRDLAVPVPEGTRPLVRLTPEWWRALGFARYLVNNNNFLPRFRKAPGQVYLQTWHGTPLKRIGLDIANQMNFSDSYLRLMRREAAAWDYLVSPSPFCSEVFPRAFGYTGEILEVGYPRNDLLVSDDASRIRDDVRRELGVPDEQKVLLYAPTWRENARHGASYAKVLFLDAAILTRRRPDVTVLVRGHANTSGRASVTDGDRVLDVTTYPDLARLYLASDLLVTDYSSVLFDYALTDRPMLFLVPDLAHYRDRLRGFYLDFEETVPGPLLRSTDEVLEHLDDDPALHAADRQRLRERFAPYDDGHATERLVERVFAGPS